MSRTSSILPATGRRSASVPARFLSWLRSCHSFPNRRLSSAVADIPTGMVNALFGSERCGTFVHVCCQTLLGVVALEQQLLVFTLQRQRRFHRNLPPGLHRALD